MEPLEDASGENGSPEMDEGNQADHGVGLDSYESELERTKSQLLVFAREMSQVYQREREKSREIGQLTDDMKADYGSIIETLALVVEAKDQYTRNHLDRCREYASALTAMINPELVTDEVQYGFLLHDVGKIGVPEAILLKPGPLSEEEQLIMRQHPLIGVQLIEPMRRLLSDSAVEIIRHHHERFDGNGYPDGLKAEEIPLSARIFSVVDAFDAMIVDRPYRTAISFAQAKQQLREGAGTQFDPAVVDAFLVLTANQAYPRLPGA